MNLQAIYTGAAVAGILFIILIIGTACYLPA